MMKIYALIDHQGVESHPSRKFGYATISLKSLYWYDEKRNLQNVQIILSKQYTHSDAVNIVEMIKSLDIIECHVENLETKKTPFDDIIFNADMVTLKVKKNSFFNLLNNPFRKLRNIKQNLLKERKISHPLFNHFSYTFLDNEIHGYVTLNSCKYEIGIIIPYELPYLEKGIYLENKVHVIEDIINEVNMDEIKCFIYNKLSQEIAQWNEEYALSKPEFINKLENNVSIDFYQDFYTLYVDDNGIFGGHNISINANYEKGMLSVDV